MQGKGAGDGINEKVMDARWTTITLMTGHVKCCLSWSLKKKED